MLALLFLQEKALKKVVKQLKDCYAEKLIDDGVVITNLNDPRTANNRRYEYSGEWLACASFSGKGKVSRAKKKMLRTSFRSIDTDLFFFSSVKSPFGLHKSSFIPFIIETIQKQAWLYKRLKDKPVQAGGTIEDLIARIQILKSYYAGIPSNYSIDTMARMNNTVLKNEELDNSSALGLSLALPAVPFDPEAVSEVSAIINQISEKWGVKPFHNFASIDEMAFEGFFRIYFDREDKDAIQTAHKWSKEVHEKLKNRGYFPYRLDNERMEDFITKNDVFWQTVRKIKGTLDENSILAKGKYNLY